MIKFALLLMWPVAMLTSSWEALQTTPPAPGGLSMPSEVSTLAELRACGLTAGPIHKVTKIIDGDTLKIDSGREIRLVGLQAPKLPLGRVDFESWPLGVEAKSKLEEFAGGQFIRLLYGGSREDRHGRILAHVLVLEDEKKGSKGIWVAQAMVSEGMARVYSFRDNKSCVAQLLAIEKEARSMGLGIWANDFYSIRNAENVNDDIDTFQLVEGQVKSAGLRSNGAYLDFGEDWRTDTSVFIAKRNLKRFEKAGLNIVKLAHRNIRVRGWIDYRNGPMIEITHPEQLELLQD